MLLIICMDTYLFSLPFILFSHFLEFNCRSGHQTNFLLSNGCRAACIMNPVIALVIKRAAGDVNGREGGHNPKARALPNAACPPTSTEISGPRKKAQVERNANDPALWCGEMSEVCTGFEALMFVIYLMQNKVILYWPFERTAFIENQHCVRYCPGCFITVISFNPPTKSMKKLYSFCQ